MAKKHTRKILLVGWDAADWKIINPLMDSGRMPALESLVNGGVMGNLATLDPPMSPMLWTSIATGKHADKHGILNFTEPAPGGSGIRPVSSSSRKVKAVWNMLMHHGYKTHAVGWWPSHPAEPLNGVCISNFYQRAHAPINKPWPLRPGTVHPREKENVFDALRVHPSELTEAHILPFVPRAAEVDQAKDKRLEGIAKIIADAASVHAAATWILENEEWDFLAVYYDAIDHFCHGYINFHPPRMDGIPEQQYEVYKDVVTGGYLFHDMMLARLLELAGPDTTVILVSDHGFHSDHLRPRRIPRNEPAGPAVQHRGYGVFCMKGPGIKKDERVYGARLLDITPTILTLCGLPTGKDMDGKPLVECFEHPPATDSIPSWEAVPGECGRLPAAVQSDPLADQEAMEQLIALGYIEPPDHNRHKALERTVRESRFYLARVHLNKREYHEALPLLEKLYEEHPDQRRYGMHLAGCYQTLNRLSECRSVVENIITREEQQRKDRLEQARQKAAEKGEQTTMPEAAADKPAAGMELLQGSLCLAEGKYLRALEHLQRAETANPRLPGLHLRIGDAYLKMGLTGDAERAFTRALEIDPDSYAAHDGMARAALRSRRPEDAATFALNAVGLLYNYPRAHYHLGMALFRLGEYARAEQAWLVTLAMAPRFKIVHRMLIRLYSRFLKNPGKAARHAELLQEIRQTEAGH